MEVDGEGVEGDGWEEEGVEVKAAQVVEEKEGGHSEVLQDSHWLESIPAVGHHSFVVNHNADRSIAALAAELAAATSDNLCPGCMSLCQAEQHALRTDNTNHCHVDHCSSSCSGPVHLQTCGGDADGFEFDYHSPADCSSQTVAAHSNQSDRNTAALGGCRMSERLAECVVLGSVNHTTGLAADCIDIVDCTIESHLIGHTNGLVGCTVLDAHTSVPLCCTGLASHSLAPGLAGCALIGRVTALDGPKTQLAVDYKLAPDLDGYTVPLLLACTWPGLVDYATVFADSYTASHSPGCNVPGLATYVTDPDRHCSTDRWLSADARSSRELQSPDTDCSQLALLAERKSLAGLTQRAVPVDCCRSSHCFAAPTPVITPSARSPCCLAALSPATTGSRS